MTANVLPGGSLPARTPRTFDWDGVEHHGPKATTPGFIAQAHDQSIAHWLPHGTGPFTPLPSGRALWPQGGRKVGERGSRRRWL
jgi:hypothetical protein